jgi:capsular polysaccharide biosynthesis protein
MRIETPILGIGDKKNPRSHRLQAEVVSFLTRFGFRTVHLEGLPFLDQVEMFSRAEVVAGTHGAGLANIVFCPPCGRVLELMPPRYCHPVYYNLACRAGLDYACVMAQEFLPRITVLT